MVADLSADDDQRPELQRLASSSPPVPKRIQPPQPHVELPRWLPPWMRVDQHPRSGEWSRRDAPSRLGDTDRSPISSPTCLEQELGKLCALARACWALKHDDGVLLEEVQERVPWTEE